MIREIQMSLASRRERLRYGFGAVFIGIAALLFLLSFRGGAAQGLTAPTAPNITKSSTTSIDDVGAFNESGEAVAGELVTITVVYNVPTGETLYAASLRVVLPDGILPYDSNPSWSAMYTGTTNVLRTTEISATQNGALVVFPTEAVPIVGPQTLTRTVSARMMQYRYVLGSQINNNTRLETQVVLRWCDDVACNLPRVLDSPTTITTARVTAIRPTINATGSGTYLDANGAGEGGGYVRLTFNAQNVGSSPTAHDIVFTATLGSGLTYVSSSGGDGAGVGTPSVDGGITYVAWDVPVSLASGASWQAVITATLPATFTVGTRFPYGTQIYYETFLGPMQDEGQYTGSATMTPLEPGLIDSKRSNLPTGTYFSIGETLTYTVMFTQAANTDLPSPYFVDDLPLGFHYISGTLSIGGGAVVTDVTVTEGVASGAFRKERLSWFMESMPVTTTERYITAVYRVHNNGLDYNDKLVLVTASDLTGSRASPNSAVLNWRPPTGIPVSSLSAVNASVNVVQPYLGNLTYFKTSRTDGAPYTREVGDLLRFKSEFRNTGRTPAYEVKICDQLPIGLVLNTQIPIAYSPNFPVPVMEPVAGDNLLCWELDVVPNGTTSYSAEYYVEILDAVVPGVPLANNFYVVDYTSMPGDVPGERHYNQIEIAVPSVSCSATGCLSVLGLTVDKTPLQANVGPEAFVTYTLSYEDTSTQFDYQNVVLTDTFDSSLASFVDAIPLPTHESDGQLVWDVGDLADTGGAITLTMQVADVIPDGVYELLNNLSWSSDEIPLHTITRSVALRAANLNLAMLGPEHVHAGEDIIYTVEYSNTGSALTSTVELTLDYGPYVEFISATPSPRLGTDNVFDDVLPNTGADHMLTVNLRVKAPLPYDLAGPLAASALLESPGAESKQANISMILDRPVLVLEKVGPPVAPGIGFSLDYTILVHNQGTYTATGAVITDTWGPYLTYNLAQNTAFGWTLSGDGTYATQSLGELGIGQVTTLLFQMAVADNSIYYMNTAELTSDQTTEQEDVEYTWQRSIATTKSATPVPAFPGRTITYTIYYTSTSPDPMLNALITDTLPSDFVYQGQSAPQGGCQSAWSFTSPGVAGGGNAVWSCSALTANGSGQFLIWGLVNADAEGSDLENSTVTSADSIPVRPIEMPLVTHVARPWLRVDKIAVPAHPVAPGNLITYTLTYENYGTDPAYNVIIKDQLPTQLTYVSCSGGDTCGESGGLVTWDFAGVPVATVGSVQVVVQVKAATAGQTAVNANYTIQSDRLPVAETITGASVSSVILDPHLAAEKLADPGYVTQTGDHITYTVRLTNDGGGILHNVVISDAIDVKTIVDQSTLSPECTVGGSPAFNEVVTCNIGTMAQGAVKIVQFEVYLAGAPVQGDSVINTAYRGSDETASEPSNATTVWVTTGCIPPHDVDFTVSANPQAGQVVTFTASAAGDTPMTFTWAFGDMETGDGQVVGHTYAVSGTYEVDMTANNGCIAPVIVSKNVYVPGAPEIVLTPTSFAKSAEEGSTTELQDTLTVSNDGTANLLWSAGVMTPTEATWLRIAVGGGDPGTSIIPQVTAPGASTPVAVYFDPTGLSAGVYTGWLHIESNDADEGTVFVEVTFTIGGDYYIYLPLVLKNY